MGGTNHNYNTCPMAVVLAYLAIRPATPGSLLTVVCLQGRVIPNQEQASNLAPSQAARQLYSADMTRQWRQRTLRFVLMKLLYAPILFPWMTEDPSARSCGHENCSLELTAHVRVLL